MAVMSLGGGLRAGIKANESQQTCQALSKVVTLGGSYRLLFPMYWDEEAEVMDLVACSVPGRKGERDKIGKSFVVLDDFDVSPTGKITDNTGLDRYYRMSRILHKASMAQEKFEAETMAKANADRMGVPIDQTALDQELKKIELQYLGDNSDKKNPIYPTKRQAVGPVVIETATECLVVPLDANDAPIWRDAKVASVSLSSTKAQQLKILLNNPNYARKGEEWLEVSYTYQGKDKNEAGRVAAFQGVADTLSIKTLFAESWEKDGVKELERVSRTPDAVASKNYNMSSNTTPDEFKAGFKAWCSKSKGLFAGIDWEDEELKRVAADFMDTGVLPKIDSLLDKFEKFVHEIAGDEVVEDSADESAAMGLAAAVAEGKVDSVRTAIDVLGEEGLDELSSLDE